MSFSIVYQDGEGEIVEKKSRFIAHVYAVHSVDEVAERLELIRSKHWQARHNCYAYILGDAGENSKFSDDREPSGTAGKPILEVISGAELTNVLVIVTRYFGGVLLGTGGLVRAYSQATKEGLANAVITVREPGKRMRIVTDYNGIGKLQYLAETRGYTILDTQYTEQVIMEMLIPEGEEEHLIAAVNEATSAKAVCERMEQVWYGLVDGKIQLLM